MTRTAKLGLTFCLFGAAIGVVAFTTHLVGMPEWTSIVEGRPMMVLLTTLTLTTSGLAGASRVREGTPRSFVVVSTIGGILVAIAGSLTLFEYAFDVVLGVDLTLPRSPREGAFPGRASPLTAVANVAIGAAIATFDVPSNRRVLPREAFALVAIFTMFVSLVGHAFGANRIYRIGETSMIGVSLPTGVGILAIAIGVLLERPDVGLMRLVTSRSPAGEIVRKLALAAIVGGPLVALALAAAVGGKGLIDLPLALAAGVVIGVALSITMVTITAIPLSRAHERLEVARERMFQLVAQAPDGVFIADLDGKYVDVNQAACRMLGYERDELIGKTIVDLIPPEDVDRLFGDREQVLSGKTVVGEWTLRRKDDSRVPVEVSTRIVADGRWQAFVRDITDRIELQRELVESRDLLKHVLESATSYGIVADDLDGRIVLWNEGARLAYGYSDAEVMGMPSENLVVSTDVEAWRSLRKRGLEEGKSDGTFRGRRGDGSEFVMRATCTRRVGERLEPTGVVVVARDLTEDERQLAEQAFLARAGVHLANCLEANDVLTVMTKLVTDYFGGVCVVDLVDEGTLVRAIVRPPHPDAAEFVDAIERSTPPATPTSVVRRVLDTKSSWLSSAPGSFRDDATSDAIRRRLAQPSPTSTMFLPMIARGNPVAVLGIISTSVDRVYGAEDLRVAEELARRAALSLDNVRLYQQSRLQGAVTTNLAEGVVVIRQRDAIIVYANPRFEATLGYEPRELVGKPISIVNAPGEQTPDETAAAIVAELGRSGAWHGEIANITKNGVAVWSYASVSSFEHAEYGPVWIAVHMDVTERRALQLANEHALREKEALLREIHHRVRNNLQVISSLFSLQRATTTNDELRALIDDSRNRVQSIAMVHELLYRSTSLAEIDFDQYLHALVESIRSAYGRPNIRLEVIAKEVRLDADRAVPCALIAAELVSNAFKHAFPERDGTITVSAGLDEGREFVIEVQDDGRGMRPDFDWQTAKSLGLRLVGMFARQLDGTVELDRASGTRFIVRFPFERRRKSARPSVEPDRPNTP